MPVSKILTRLTRGRRWTWWQLLTHIAAWLPLIVLIWDAQRRNLTANPIQEATFRTGTTALVLLVLSLVCTPASTLFGLKQAVKLRRPLGLYGFMYAAIHFFIFSVVDYGLDLGLIQETVVEKRYVLVGLAAFLLLTPLAITSTRGWMKRLGKRWKKLHWLVYLAVPLAVVHYVWLVKADIRVPLQYAAVVVVLLALRLPPVRRYLSGLRYRLLPKPKPIPTRTTSPHMPPTHRAASHPTAPDL